MFGTLATRWVLLDEYTPAAADEAVEALNELLAGTTFLLRSVHRSGDAETDRGTVRCSLPRTVDDEPPIQCSVIDNQDGIIIPVQPTLHLTVPSESGKRTEITILQQAAHLFVPCEHGLMKYYIHAIQPITP